MDQSQYDDILSAINSRSPWEQKMSSYYTLRYDGIRRTAKPYKNAPDVHYPLVDSVIDKLKPFYAQQMFGDLVVATFVGLDNAPRDQVAQAEQWFDYKIRQCSNFEREMMNGIDMMLHYGLCPVKIYWDEDSECVAFEAIDPMYVIVPKSTKNRNPDWLVHVRQFSRASYEAQKNFNQDKEFVDRIVGGAMSSNTSGSISQKEQSEAQREGLTYASDKDRIIVWEIYSKNKDKWQVETIAPQIGIDGEVRKKFNLPYTNAKNDRTVCPFVVLRNEDTTTGWYTPRGIAEILMSHELSLCKSWNSKLQFLDFFGHPTYRNDGLAPINAQDFQAAPGRILPQGVVPNVSTGAPMDFEQEMSFVRALAEDRIQIPDLGGSQHLNGAPGMAGEVTATQVNAVMSLSNQSNDLRARLFRLQLAEIFSQGWELLKDNAGDGTDFITDGIVSQLPPELLEKEYSIHPSGSADSWNKAYKIQDATMTYQLLLGKPNVNQDELLQYFLETKDPRLSKRLFLDTGMGSMLEGEKQASELLLMEAGFPAVVKPADKDAIHLQNMGEWLQMKMQKQMPITPDTAALVMKHAMSHAQQASQKQDDKAMAIVKSMGPAMQMLQGIVAQGGQPGQQQPGSVPGQQPKESISINYKDAPPSVQRQMEQAAGFQPALPQESQMQAAEMAAKAQPKQAAAGDGPNQQAAEMALAQQQQAMKLRHSEENHRQTLRHRDENNALHMQVQAAQARQQQEQQAVQAVQQAATKAQAAGPAQQQQSPNQQPKEPKQPVIHIHPTIQVPPIELPQAPAPVIHLMPRKGGNKINLRRNAKGDLEGADVTD